jgi:hypothetical protein
MPPQLNRTEELVAYFVNRCQGGELGRTRLMKLLYLADYEARRFMGRPLSDITYVWHHYGPYDPAVERTVATLKARDVVTEERVIYPNGHAGYLYSAGPAPFKAYSFSPAEEAILDYVCRQYSRVQLKELLEDIVYQTEPMLKAQERGERDLDMDEVNNTRGNELTVPFEELVERSKRVASGQYIAHEEAMRLLEGVSAVA